MGVHGSWVQLARIDNNANSVPKGAGRVRKGQPLSNGPGANGQPTRFWYLENVSSVFVSFHTDLYFPDQED